MLVKSGSCSGSPGRQLAMGEARFSEVPSTRQTISSAPIRSVLTRGMPIWRRLSCARQARRHGSVSPRPSASTSDGLASAARSVGYSIPPPRGLGVLPELYAAEVGQEIGKVPKFG